MPFLFGGGGGSSIPAPTTNQQPQAGQAQFYQPQNQVGSDTSYTQLLDSLLGQYTGGQTPPQQSYPQAQSLAQYGGDLAGPGGLISILAGNQIYGNPGWGQQTQAAQDASNYGYNSISTLERMLQQATQGQGGMLNAANSIAGYAPQAAGLAGSTAGLGASIPGYAGATAALAPYLSGLSSQVAGGIGPTQGLAGLAAGQIPGINQAAGQLSGLSQGLLPAGSPLIDDIIAQARRSEGVGQLQGGAQNVLQLSQALANKPAGAGMLDTAGQDILAQGKQLAALPAGAGQLFKGSQNLLNAGYDPQSQLRNQLTQQTADQSNAINAMSGLSSSPYGAGLTSDALSNFNINWQNQQLGREQAALQGATGGFEGAQALRQGKQNFLTNAAAAASGAFGEAENIRAQKAAIAEGGLGAAAGAYGQAGSLIANKANMDAQALSGLQNLYQGAGGLATQGANALAQGAGVAGTAGGLYGQAGQIGGQAGGLASGAGGLYGNAVNQLLGGGSLNTQAAGQLGQAGQLGAQASGIYGQLPGAAAANAGALGAVSDIQTRLGGLPAQTFSQQQQQALQAALAEFGAVNPALSGLTNATNMGLSQYALPETVLSDLANYLKLGQNSSLAAGQLGLVNQAQGQPDLAGIGSLAMGGGLGGLAFGSGGLGGALGLGSGGLLGAGVDALGLGGAGAQDFFGGATGAGGVVSDLFTALFA